MVTQYSRVEHPARVRTGTRTSTAPRRRALDARAALHGREHAAHLRTAHRHALRVERLAFDFPAASRAEVDAVGEVAHVGRAGVLLHRPGLPPQAEPQVAVTLPAVEDLLGALDRLLGGLLRLA